jgi:hypothetical protein
MYWQAYFMQRDLTTKNMPFLVVKEFGKYLKLRQVLDACECFSFQTWRKMTQCRVDPFEPVHANYIFCQHKIRSPTINSEPALQIQGSMLTDD